jgi:hypothetical protein
MYGFQDWGSVRREGKLAGHNGKVVVDGESKMENEGDGEWRSSGEGW